MTGGRALYSDLRSKFNNLKRRGRGAGAVYSEGQVEQVCLNLATGRTETRFSYEQTDMTKNITFSSLRWWTVVIVPQYQMSSDA